MSHSAGLHRPTMRKTCTGVSGRTWACPPTAWTRRSSRRTGSTARIWSTWRSECSETSVRPRTRCRTRIPGCSPPTSAEIADERGWLIVVTSRLCLDRIRSAPARRESAHDASSIEFAAPSIGPPLADPADRVTFDDSVRLALLVVLQRLSPAERVVFVLHDIFGMPFATVAQTVGRTPQACRQLATRARQKITAEEGSTRFEIPSAEHRLVTEKFIAACANGDLDGLLAVLAPDAWGDVDHGPGAARPHVVVTGADRVGRNVLRFWGPGMTLVSMPAGAQPAALGFRRPRASRNSGIYHARGADPVCACHHRSGQAEFPHRPACLALLAELPPIADWPADLRGVTTGRRLSSLPVP